MIPAPRSPAGPAAFAQGLTKRFGDAIAVDGIDFEVRRGEAFGFLGPNGAGKTSTMRMIGCVSPASGGTLEVLGMDPDRDGPEIRSRLGVVPQSDALDQELTVEENLVVYGRYFRLSRAVARRRARELLDFVQLADRASDRVERLSGGMRRRLSIARSLVNRPDLVLLDEPTTGLDPQARQALWDRLYQLRQEGVTLIVTTHYMEEAEHLCDRLVIMDQARIVARGTPAELIARYASREVVELRFGATETPDLADLDGAISRVEVLRDRVLVSTGDGDAALAALHARGIEADRVVVRRGSLEDVFLRITGRSLEE